MFKKKIKNFKDISKDISALENQENLFFFTNILKNIEHFVFFGTLLGLTRDKQLIEGDDDVDFYINLKNRNELIKVLIKNNIDVDLSLSINKTDYFLQIKRNFNNKNLICEFYFYDDQIDNKYIYERWNFDGRPHDSNKILKIPKVFIYPIKKELFKKTYISFPKENELICEYLYGSTWKKKLKKDKEYEISVINGKPYLYTIKKFFNFKIKKLIL